MSGGGRRPGDPRTKIVATVGPATESAERLAALIEAGVDVFRLNLAHGERAWHETVLVRIREASRVLDRPVAVLADLPGPKIRLGTLPGGRLECTADQRLRLVATPPGDRDPDDLPVAYLPLLEQLAVGDLVLLADGMVSLQVESREGAAVVCRVVQPGEIRSGSGVNVPGVTLREGALTEADHAHLGWAVRQEVDFLGQSFVRRADDVRELRRALAVLGARPRIVAKIEKAQAVAALPEILAETDAVMVARGDLGVEIDVARMAEVQKQIIRRCREARVPVITATQMLESMRSSRRPTRAEATDVANAILDGSDAVMLSAETAIGSYPVEAVAMMRAIARATEPLLAGFAAEAAGPGAPDPSVGTALIEAAGGLAERIQAKLVLVATTGGDTALTLSAPRRLTPVLGVSDDETAIRRMCLYWGVLPFHDAALGRPETRHPGALLDHLVARGRERGLLATGDRVVVVASPHWTTTGHPAMTVVTVT